MSPTGLEGGERATGSAPALSVVNLSKTFPGTRALIDFGIEIAAGEIRALAGGNGSGKSTFIKILSGYHRPDPGGEIRIGGEAMHAGHPKDSHKLGARFVHQDLGLVDESSVLDNLCLDSGFSTRFGTIRAGANRRRARAALAHVGLSLDPDVAVARLSAAEKTGLAVARALTDAEHDGVRLLVLDEPTATLPAAEVRVLLDMVRSIAASGVGVLYVTHRLDEIFDIASKVTVLRNGELVVTAEVDGMTRGDLVHHLVGSAVDDVRRDTGATSTRREPVLALRHLTSDVLDDVSLEVRPGEVVGISGVTGSGRELLCATVFGALPRTGGEVTVGSTAIPAFEPDTAIRAGLAFMPSDRKIHGGLMEMTAAENLTLATLADFWRAPYVRRKMEVTETASWFDRLSVRPGWAHEEPLSSFSGGNQQKILLSKWLRLKPKVLLLEEPTQGVDVAAKAEIHHHLLEAAASGTAIVVSSSDIDELVAVCSRVLVLSEGAIATTLSGSELTVPALTRESLIAHRSWGTPHELQPEEVS